MLSTSIFMRFIFTTCKFNEQANKCCDCVFYLMGLKTSTTCWTWAALQRHKSRKISLILFCVFLFLCSHLSPVHTFIFRTELTKIDFIIVRRTLPENDDVHRKSLCVTHSLVRTFARHRFDICL